MNYFKYLKNSFEPLRLNNEMDLSEQRLSHPLELFFDLVFVVAIGKVGHAFLHPELSSLVVSVILFWGVFQIWKNITKFNAYFFQKGLITSFLFVLVMLPVFFIVSISDYTDTSNVLLLVASFSFSRLTLTFAWYKLIYKNKQITNKFINYLAKKYALLYLISSLIMIIGIFDYKYFYLILIGTVILELIFAQYIPHLAKKKAKDRIPVIDEELIQERRVLFTILVWGEALVTAGSVFSEYDSFIRAIIMSLMLFFIIAFFFLRAVAAFGDTYNIRAMGPYMLEFTEYTFPLITLSLFVCLAGIAIAPTVDSLARIIVIFDVLYISISHLYANITQSKNTTDMNLKYFVKVDNVMLIIQLVMIAGLVFVNNPPIFISIILIIFILHFLAIPIRYGKTELF